MPAPPPPGTDTDEGFWRRNSGCYGGGGLAVFGFVCGLGGGWAELAQRLAYALQIFTPFGVIWRLLHQLAELGFGLAQQQHAGFGFAHVDIALAEFG